MRRSEVVFGVAIVALCLIGAEVWQYLAIRAERKHDAEVSTRLSQLTSERDQLKAQRDKLLAETNPATIALRKDCAVTALRMFRALGYNEHIQKNESGMPRTEGYSSHYSRRLGRCLLSYDDENYSYDPKAGGHQTITKGIMDADERKQIGDYLWISSDKKYWEQKPMMCHRNVPGQAESWCHSSGEWDDFQNDLMNS